jgi:hypothetical protein
MIHGTEKSLPHWVNELTRKIRQNILIPVQKPGYDASITYKTITIHDDLFIVFKETKR